MAVLPITEERLRNASDPIALFSSPESCVTLFAYAVNGDDASNAMDAAGWLVQWTLLLYDPGDVLELIYQTCKSLSGTESSVTRTSELTVGQNYVFGLISDMANIILDMLYSPVETGLTLPIEPSVVERLAVYLSKFQSLNLYPAAQVPAP